MTQIHRTTFIIEVLSEGPFAAESPSSFEDPFDLSAINYAITDGDCLGDVKRLGSVIIQPEKVQAELLRLGNDGDFFNRGSNFIEDSLVGYPDGWYVFDREGEYLDGPVETEEDAEAVRREPGDWVGQFDGGYLDLSYAPASVDAKLATKGQQT